MRPPCHRIISLILTSALGTMLQYIYTRDYQLKTLAMTAMEERTDCRWCVCARNLYFRFGHEAFSGIFYTFGSGVANITRASNAEIDSASEPGFARTGVPVNQPLWQALYGNIAAYWNVHQMENPGHSYILAKMPPLNLQLPLSSGQWE